MGMYATDSTWENPLERPDVAHRYHKPGAILGYVPRLPHLPQQCDWYETWTAVTVQSAGMR